MRQAVIVDAVRTPSGRGRASGALAATHPVDLLAGVLKALAERNDLETARIDDVLAGCVTQVGEQSLNIGRNAVLAAGFPEHVPATTIDRQCGSSQQAVHFAAQGVLAGAYDVVIACGVESMSRVPLFAAVGESDPYGGLHRARYPDGLVQQGISAELVAQRWKLRREELDGYALRSHERAWRATAAGAFEGELVGVRGPGGEPLAARDETIRPDTTLERLAALPPAFTGLPGAERHPDLEWMHTSGNSSPLTDGASAVLIMSEGRAAELGLRPRARFHSFAVAADDPLLMLTAVVPATRAALAKGGLTADLIDAYEVNEAFASVPLVWQRELGVDDERLNVRGGSIALGHPLGSSGTRLLTTLLNTLEGTGGRYGLQTMCELGGMANATVIERL